MYYNKERFARAKNKYKEYEGNDSMANIIDYIEWRGDLSFKVSPFNEVDNLIFSQLSYVDFSGIVPGTDSRKSITLKEAGDKFFMMHDEEEISKEFILTRNSIELLKKMADSRRFSALRLSAYIQNTDVEQETQFSAVCMEPDRKTVYIAYRGTDDTIVGWKEDFNMSFMEAVPAQTEAVRYLEQVMRYKFKKIVLGGHSKGGNLAVYAAVNCTENIKKKIIRVYNNDGPGFTKRMAFSNEYKAMLPKIVTIVPESSVVGMLLEREGEYTVVKSNQNGLMQHDALSWNVTGSGFECIEEINPKSLLLNHSIKSWLDTLDNAQREQFVDSLYTILTSTQAKTLRELKSHGWRSVAALLKTFSSMDKETKKFVTMTIQALIKESSRFKKKTPETDKERTL